MINRCLNSLQMTCKSFFWLVRSPNTQNKKWIPLGEYVIGQLFEI